MTPDVVVDIGNSRMKWGLCAGGRVTESLSLPLDARRGLDGRAVGHGT